jgi:hypothetical protein
MARARTRAIVICGHRRICSTSQEDLLAARTLPDARMVKILERVGNKAGYECCSRE